MTYEFPNEYLKRYGDLLVNYALGGGAGIQPGEVVCVRGPESARPLYAEVCRAVWRAGGHVVHDYRPDADASVNLMRDFFELASPEQLSWFPDA
jgi:leucyl aminopeptidase (aminopeptidase T)